MSAEEILTYVNDNIYGVWFLIGAVLVFWMQAGFAMVEAGFTRAKNSGNIIMKNLMDFCIGTVMWFLIGSSLMLGTGGDVAGLFGKLNFSVFSDYAHFDFSGFVFNLVFCATTATIVSGAMAERTKFSSYCIYSAVISAIIYPIEAHWTWGGGFLAEWGFHDYAGSNCIHMVGGICAFIGAAMLGPRIGKFTKENGKVTKVHAIPGHNLVIGALGVFILWMGWYGFNGAAATDLSTLGSVLLTTTVAPAVATVVCMLFTWIRYGKPDVSMCLNASLAGLVAITAPCDVTDCLGAAIIGAVSGVLVVFGVWFCDHVVHVDDPVGAVAVHMFNGIWGTIAVGLFATSSAPGFAVAGIKEGLFYGGGLTQLGLQLAGMCITACWTIVTIVPTFFIIKKTNGLRVSEEEEILGLDSTEHGLESSYAGFIMSQPSVLSEGEEAPVAAAVPVTVAPGTTLTATGAPKFTKIVIITRQNKMTDLMHALNSIGVTGITMTNVLGCGTQKGKTNYYRGAELEMNLLPKVKIEVVVSAVPVEKVVTTARKALYTGHIGDGKIFVYDIENVIKVRTGEEGYAALQESEE